ncbi:MAG: Rieske (2Fe-2S) protein [Polyangiaceae bacterium]|nr:Rieske (2Fe-2S) protein [Polyangiaceae bacterium]
MKPDWIDVGALSDLPEGEPVLRKDEGGRRFACVRRGGEVHAFDDRCPHQGYPLSQGTVRGGVLTCEWHNWKFELATGACAFGGEPVRRYATRTEGGRVFLNRAVDTPAEARRLVAGLRAALARDEPARALREGLRLGQLGLGGVDGEGLGRLYVAFEVLARDGAERAEYGFDHGLALLADLCAWVERGWIPTEEAFVVAAHAIAEPSLHLGPRARHAAKRGLGALLPALAGYEHDDPAKVAEALRAERREEAEARVRELVEVRGVAGARRALLPFVAEHLLDYGHGAIFLTKACELAARFPGAADEVLAASAVQLAWATAETKLPPFAATRAALERLAGIALAEPGRPDPPADWDRGAYEAEVLAGERQAAEATVERLARGADPIALLRAAAHAGAVRLSRFDPAWERRVDAEVGVLDVTHVVTHAEAAITLARDATAREAAQLAVLAAAFVGRVNSGDAPGRDAAVDARGSGSPPAPCAPNPVDARGSGSPPAPGRLIDAIEARDVGRALAIAAGLDGPARQAAYAEIAPFAAFDAAVRPIFNAHTVKVTEALRRLEAGDPRADGAYLRALLSYLVPVRRETRVRRIAEVARRFMRDGRPPEGLY